MTNIAKKTCHELILSSILEEHIGKANGKETTTK